MKIINIFIAIILATYSVSVGAKAPPPGSGSADVPANILIMLDTSGSMNEKTNQSKLFEKPTGVCNDSKGNVYVVEEYRHKVVKFDSDGALIKVVGGRRGNGNGQLYYPFHCVVDKDDNLYVSDYANHRGQKFDSDGNWKQNYTGGQLPSGIAVDDDGNVYLGLRSRGVIRKYSNNGTYLLEWSSGQSPYGISIHNNIVYVVNMWTSNQKIKRYDTSGTALASITPQGGSMLASLTVNDNGIYLTHTFAHFIDRYTIDGAFIKRTGAFGSGPGQFKYVWDISADSDGNIWATDWHNHRVNKFTKDLVFVSGLNGSSNSRLDDAKKVIKKIVSSSELNKSANFGLMDWNSQATMRVNVSHTGATEIYNMIDSLNAGGMTFIQHAMELARTYLRGGNTPIVYPECQETVLIVISDGGFNGNIQAGYDAAADMFQNDKIRTVVVSFYSGNQTTHKKLAEAGGTYFDDGDPNNDYSPISAANWQELYNAISKIIQATVQSRQTFTKPVILPSTSGGSDYIFQSTFLYKNYSLKLGACTTNGKKAESCQWEGHLSKYKLLSDGTINPVYDWDAGTLLNEKNSSDRKIWAMMEFMGANTSINNFNTNNLIEIKMIIDEASGKLSTDEEVTDVINFVRGIDSYDEDRDTNKAEQRWKLGDIYHSELKVVGPPTYRTTDDVEKSNTEAYYRYQNNYDGFKNGNRCGGSCKSRKEIVYVGANDGMLHAFDADTGEELWAFIPPVMVKNITKFIAVKPNTSNAIYGVDGSIVVKDIFFDKGQGKKWYTVLIAGQGRGGQSYFALDITKPLAPDFLFAFENNILDKRVYHWDGKGNRKSLSYDKKNIASEYDYSKLGETWSVPSIVPMIKNNILRWVAVFGSGYNGGTNTTFGSSIYVIDLEDKGKVLKRIDLTDVNNNIANSVPASLVSVTPDTTSKAKYKGSMIYVADLESKKWKLNLTDKGTLYDLTPIFDGEATIENDRMEFFQITPTIGTDGNLWSYYGTGNQQSVQTVSANIKNRIFAIKDVDFPDYKSVSGLNNTATSSLRNTTTKGSTCPAPTDLGWYINLETNQRITGKLALFNEILYATRYRPDSALICKPGYATLTEHSNSCGSLERTIELGKGIATGVVIHKGKIYIGISGNEQKDDLKDEQGKIIGKKTGNIIILETSNSGAGGKPKITNESWREIF
jgi:type IV pilus assembly protein PilY1